MSIEIIEEKRRYQKVVTIIKGLNPTRALLKKLKKKLSCGGTIKNGEVELQGSHKMKILKLIKDFK